MKSTVQHDITAELVARGWPAAAAQHIAVPPPETPGEPNRSLTLRRIAATYGADWSVVCSLELTVCTPAELNVMLARVCGSAPVMTADQADTVVIWCASRVGRRPH